MGIACAYYGRCIGLNHRFYIPKRLKNNYLLFNVSTLKHCGNDKEIF